VLAVLAASPVTAVAVHGAYGGSFAGFWAVRLAAGFTAGVLTWLVVRRVPRTRTVSRWAHRVLLLALAEVALVAYWAATAPPTAAFTADARVFLAVPLVPVVIGALALTDGPVAHALGTPRMRHAGRLSYALYLVHFPLIEVALVVMTRFPALAPHTAAAGLLVPHVVVLSVVLAHLAHRWIEEPAQAWLLGAPRSCALARARARISAHRRVTPEGRVTAGRPRRSSRPLVPTRVSRPVPEGGGRLAGTPAAEVAVDAARATDVIVGSLRRRISPA
jgi:peptidoglycan/LPS O-acetylase OafA/YrhL